MYALGLPLNFSRKTTEYIQEKDPDVSLARNPHWIWTDVAEVLLGPDGMRASVRSARSLPLQGARLVIRCLAIERVPVDGMAVRSSGRSRRNLKTPS